MTLVGRGRMKLPWLGVEGLGSTGGEGGEEGGRDRRRRGRGDKGAAEREGEYQVKLGHRSRTATRVILGRGSASAPRLRGSRRRGGPRPPPREVAANEGLTGRSGGGARRGSGDAPAPLLSGSYLKKRKEMLHEKVNALQTNIIYIDNQTTKD